MPSLLHGQAEARRHRRAGRAVPAPLRRPQGQEVLSLPPERRRQLQEIGLRALLKRRLGPDAGPTGVQARTVRLAGGAAIVIPESGIAAVFADSTAGLGPAIDLAAGERAERLFFFSERNTGDVARRAAEFTLPTEVIDPDGDFEVLDPLPAPGPDPMPPALEPARERLRGAGLQPVWEHGVLTGEWLGLEVARVTDQGLEVGVGRHDREANRLLHPGGPSDAFLDQVVATVRERRRDGALAHPANRLSPERWLRAVLLAEPSRVGLADLQEMSPPDPRHDLRQRAVAPAWSSDGTVVVCSVGVDPDVVAQAADARLQSPGGRDARLVIVVPVADDHPLTRRLARLLRVPAEIATVPRGWRSVD